MSLIDTYRRDVERKQKEISKLNEDRAKEINKLAANTKKINDANRAIRSTTSNATIKSKQSQIASIQNDSANIGKKIAQIESDIAKKNTELLNYQQKLQKEEIKEQKKNSDAIKRRNFEFNTKFNNYDIQQQQIRTEIQDLKKLPEQINVLFLASNPIDSEKLRLDQEAREIEDFIKRSKHRDSIKFISKWAVRSSDILQAINEVNPTIIHFSGHGSSDGCLVLQKTDGNSLFVPKEAIVKTIKTASDEVRLIFFNACFSEVQAEAVTQDIEVAIGMSSSIEDTAAIKFAAQFYSSIGFGLSVQKAFDQSVALLMLEDMHEEDTPKLFHN
ncbi:MAG: CHAT domain-containing protein, partial [Deferribacterales bacterium]